MKSLYDLNNNEGEILGPGTDLVVSLVAVLILLLSIYSLSSNQKIFHLEKIVAGEKTLTEALLDKEKKIKGLKDSLLFLQKKNSSICGIRYTFKNNKRLAVKDYF